MIFPNFPFKVGDIGSDLGHLEEGNSASPTNPQVSSAPGLMQLSFSLNAWELVTTT